MVYMGYPFLLSVLPVDSIHDTLLVLKRLLSLRDVSFILKNWLLLRKYATSPSAFSGWAFSHNLARQHYLVSRHS